MPFGTGLISDIGHIPVFILAAKMHDSPPWAAGHVPEGGFQSRTSGGAVHPLRTAVGLASGHAAANRFPFRLGLCLIHLLASVS